MADQLIRIDRRFRGPPDSGNGGYVAGLLAKALGGSGVEVTLRAPPPLDRDIARRGRRGRGGTAGRGCADRGRATAGGRYRSFHAPPSLDVARDAERAMPASIIIPFPAASCAGPSARRGTGCGFFRVRWRAMTVAGVVDPRREPERQRGRRRNRTSSGPRSIARAISRCASAPGSPCSGGLPPRSCAAPSVGEAMVVTGWRSRARAASIASGPRSTTATAICAPRRWRRG